MKQNKDVRSSSAYRMHSYPTAVCEQEKINKLNNAENVSTFLLTTTFIDVVCILSDWYFFIL